MEQNLDDCVGHESVSRMCEPFAKVEKEDNLLVFLPFEEGLSSFFDGPALEMVDLHLEPRASDSKPMKNISQRPQQRCGRGHLPRSQDKASAELRPLPALNADSGSQDSNQY